MDQDHCNSFIMVNLDHKMLINVTPVKMHYPDNIFLNFAQKHGLWKLVRCTDNDNLQHMFLSRNKKNTFCLKKKKKVLYLELCSYLIESSSHSPLPLSRLIQHTTF